LEPISENQIILIVLDLVSLTTSNIWIGYRKNRCVHITIYISKFIIKKKKYFEKNRKVFPYCNYFHFPNFRTFQNFWQPLVLILIGKRNIFKSYSFSAFFY